jgi:hypothetical protein
MSTLLNQFYNDEHTREEVKEFLFQTLDKYALEKVYKKEDTKSIAEAKETIEQAFSELQDLYAPKKKMEVINPAR